MHACVAAMAFLQKYVLVVTCSWVAHLAGTATFAQSSDVTDAVTDFFSTDFFSKYPRDDPEGRSFSDSPSPQCCVAADCVQSDQPTSFAVVTSIRSAKYIILLRELECSVRRTNPNLPLIVLSVANELPDYIIEEIQSFALYKEVPNIEYESVLKPIFSKNWFRLNAWNLTDYTSLIMVDCDTIVLTDLNHVFNLPTHFAWSYLNGRFLTWNKGGFIMFRPCQAVFEHMLKILESDHTKRFPARLAEQSFLHWYFGYTGLRLPMEYNANSKNLSPQGLTESGVVPFVVHFADAKPFRVTVNDPVWPYMCHRYYKHHHEYSPFFN